MNFTIERIKNNILYAFDGMNILFPFGPLIHKKGFRGEFQAFQIGKFRWKCFDTSNNIKYTCIILRFRDSMGNIEVEIKNIEGIVTQISSLCSIIYESYYKHKDKNKIKFLLRTNYDGVLQETEITSY